MSRTTKDWLSLFFKGTAMGAADAIPGVSGGTVAFISGIYEELLDSIRNRHEAWHNLGPLLVATSRRSLKVGSSTTPFYRP